MIKYVLLASTMVIASPVLAQHMSPAQTGAPATAQPTPSTGAAPASGDMDKSRTAASMPSETTAAQSAAPMTEEKADQAAQPAQSAAAPTTPAAPAADASTQVAAVVDSEFPAYDKDKSGALSNREFASWIDALKMKTDPAAKPDTAYNAAAFKQADADKSKSVSKAELVAFLGNGSGGAGAQ